MGGGQPNDFFPRIVDPQNQQLNFPYVRVINFDFEDLEDVIIITIAYLIIIKV